MRRVGFFLAAAVVMAGCGGTPSTDDGSGYKSQYLDVHKDESADKVIVDDVRMVREWNYIQLKSTKAMIHAAVNKQASQATHHAVLHSANTYVILSEPSANIKDGDYLHFCGGSGSVASASITIGDSGSNEDLVTVALSQIAACA